MSWNGRERARTKGSFAFGSSTPRDLSYMNKVPCKMRVYNAKTEPLEKREEPPLSKFVKMAHTTTHSADASVSGGRVAFGSGTPRQFLHLSQIPKYLRVYDAPLLSSRPPRSITMPPKNRKVMVHPEEMDEISSEPDLVSHRVELVPKRISTMGGVRKSEERRVSTVKEITKELPTEDKIVHRAREDEHPHIENDAVALMEMVEDQDISGEIEKAGSVVEADSIENAQSFINP